MYEISLGGLSRLLSSRYAKEDAEWLIVAVKVGEGSPEYIVNYLDNFEDKRKYYEEAYNEDLTLKRNPNVRIVDFDLVDNLDEIGIMVGHIQHDYLSGDYDTEVVG